MAFTPKDWKDAPDHSTPLSAAALEDLEARVAAYADSVSGGSGTAPGAPFFVSPALMGNDTGLPDDWASLQKYQLPTDAPTYFVSVLFHIVNSTENIWVAAIRDEAHWNDYWVGDGIEPTQTVDAHAHASTDVGQGFLFDEMLVVPGGWYIVGRTFADTAFISRVTVIPLGGA
jgi:hypothetical protein